MSQATSVTRPRSWDRWLLVIALAAVFGGGALIQARVGDLRKELEATTEALGRVQSQTDELSDRVESDSVSKLSDRITAVTGSVEDLQSRTDRLEGRLTSVETGIAELTSIRSEVRRVREEFQATLERAQVQGNVSAQVEAAIGELEDRIETRIQQIAAEIERVNAHVSDNTVGLEVRIDEIRRRTAELGDAFASVETRVGALEDEMAAHTAAPPEPVEEVIVYRVRPGDTLWTISAALLGSPLRYERILEANELESPTRLRTGQELLIPVTIAETRGNTEPEGQP